MLTTSVEDAINVVLFLLQDKCGTVDKKTICNLLKFECIKTGGELPLALLTFYVAIVILNRTAVKYATQGKVKIDVLEIDYTKQSSELRLIAKELRIEADNCKELIVTPAAVVNIVDHCIQPLKLLYDNCGCEIAPTSMIVNNCNFDCCDECE